MTKSKDQSAIGRGYASNDELHREFVSQESPMPMSINEQYDAGQRQMLCYTKLEEECDLQHKFALERQAKLDEIYHVCVTKMQRTANTEVHAVLNTIKGIILKTPGAKP